MIQAIEVEGLTKDLSAQPARRDAGLGPGWGFLQDPSKKATSRIVWQQNAKRESWSPAILRDQIPQYLAKKSLKCAFSGGLAKTPNIGR